MDEDHSRMQALPTQQQQQQRQQPAKSPVITTRPTPSTFRAVSPPITPSSRASASRLFGGAYNREAQVDSGSWRQSSPGDPSSLPGSPNSGRSGNNPVGSSVGATSVWGDEGGGREMMCLEAVDLGDVLGVYQENSAPEQVRREFKGF